MFRSRPALLRRLLAGLTASVVLLATGTAPASADAVVPVKPAPRAAALTGPIHWSFEDGADGWQQASGSLLGTWRSTRPNFHLHTSVPVNREGRASITTLEGPAADLYTSLLPANIRGMDLRATIGPGPSPYLGTLRSPDFVLERPVLSALVAGGDGTSSYLGVYDAAGRRLAMLVGGESEWFTRRTVDLREHLGEVLHLRAVDGGAVGAWNWIAVDDVRANLPAMPENTTARRRPGGVTVSWDAVREPGVRYVVSRSRDPEAIGRVLGRTRATTWLDPDLPDDADTYYRVRAIAPDGSVSESGRTFLRHVLDLHSRGRTPVYRGRHATAIEFPVGPIGSGGIRLFGDGTRNLSWIFNIDGEFTAFYPDRREGMVPDSFLALRAEPDGGRAVVRALQSTPVAGFTPMRDVAFRGEFPLARYDFDDPALPVRVHEEVFSPTIPGDLENSSIPTAVTTVVVRNPSDRLVRVSLLASQQNAVGLDGRTTPSGRTALGYGTNRNVVTRDASGAHLAMTGCLHGVPLQLQVLVRCQGGLQLSLLRRSATGTASWVGADGLRERFAADGTVAGPSQASSPLPLTTVDGALADTVRLGPGETVRFPMTFSWWLPSSGPREFGGQGEFYTTRWPSAAAVDADVVRRLPALTRATGLFHDTMYDSTLPQYVLDRLTAPLGMLRSPTVFWAHNGFFGGWEGTGCCTGMPTHVWQYAQSGPRLWPDVGRMWLDQWFRAQQNDGTIPYRYTVPTYSTDGQTGVVLSAYRHLLVTGDRGWARTSWPSVAAAMDNIISRNDPDEDGLLTGDQPTTVDEGLTTTSSWLGSMYIAALRASARFADAVGDDASARRYERIAATASRRQNRVLWNGDYFAQEPSSTSSGVAYGQATAADMLLGQWWSGQLDLGRVYAENRMRSSLRALWRHNFHEDLTGDDPFGVASEWRREVEPEDAGLQMFAWPRGGRPSNEPRYVDEMWTGIQYEVAATYLQRGMLDEGLRLVRAVSDTVDGRLRREVFLGGCGMGDGGGNPFGDGECGTFYARSMGSWSILLALQGFSYDATGARIGFAPRLTPDDHRSFFSAGTAWGTFAQRRSGGSQVDELIVRHGRLDLRRLDLATPSGYRLAEVLLDGVPVPARASAAGGVVLARRVEVLAGSRIVVRFGG